MFLTLGEINFTNNSALINWPKIIGKNIMPVFLPFLGCPCRCVYCSQELQTGKSIRNKEHEIAKLLAKCQEMLSFSHNKEASLPELAFYGGTFTALENRYFKMCLDFAGNAFAKGLISGFRCSTRPDYIEKKRLVEMKEAGCNLVELGIQSFNDQSLVISERGYDRKTCLRSIEIIQSLNMETCAQLLPGMPGVSCDVFLEDVATALSAKVNYMRFYPCLVLPETKLAKMWRMGVYSAWNIEETIAALAKGWLMAREKGVTVIRIGLAPQRGLQDAVLAGPHHPALGSRIMAHALFLFISQILNEFNKDIGESFCLYAPAWTRGYFWGWKRELEKQWLKIGLKKIIFWQENNLRLEILSMN